VVCNVDPGTEHSNPWVLNLHSNPVVDVQVGACSFSSPCMDVVISRL
jgi:hypothetical protein